MESNRKKTKLTELAEKRGELDGVPERIQTYDLGSGVRRSHCLLDASLFARHLSVACPNRLKAPLNYGFGLKTMRKSGPIVSRSILGNKGRRGVGWEARIRTLIA
jgi:hypothetical protein